MNYRRSFRDLEDKSFIELLEHSSELTFEGQLHLLEIAKERQLENVDALIVELEKHIEVEMEDVRSLKYLNHLGFSVDYSANQLKIVRSKATRNIDIFGLLIGVLLSPVIYYAYQSILELMDGQLSFILFISLVAFLGLSFLSVALIYKCLNRIIEYRGFELSKASVGAVFVSKNFSAGAIKKTIESSSLQVVGDDFQMSLVCENAGKQVEIITTRGGVRAMETLKALHQQLI